MNYKRIVIVGGCGTVATSNLMSAIVKEAARVQRAEKGSMLTDGDFPWIEVVNVPFFPGDVEMTECPPWAANMLTQVVGYAARRDDFHHTNLQPVIILACNSWYHLFGEQLAEVGVDCSVIDYIIEEAKRFGATGVVGTRPSIEQYGKHFGCDVDQQLVDAKIELGIQQTLSIEDLHAICMLSSHDKTLLGCTELHADNLSDNGFTSYISSIDLMAKWAVNQWKQQ